MTSRFFPGIPDFDVHAEDPVQADHIQTLLEWFRWYFSYFCPMHVFRSCDDGLRGCDSSYSPLRTPGCQPISTSDYTYFVGTVTTTGKLKTSSGTSTSSSDVNNLPQGVSVWDPTGKYYSSPLSYYMQAGAIYVESWAKPYGVDD